jgi:hypothetical protein
MSSVAVQSNFHAWNEALHVHSPLTLMTDSPLRVPSGPQFASVAGLHEIRRPVNSFLISATKPYFIGEM